MAQRVSRWRSQQRLAGRDDGGDLVAHADFSAAGGRQPAARSLAASRSTAAPPRRGRRPTVLVVSSDVQATGVLHACHLAGLRVPEDVAVVSFDGTLAGRYAQPSLTSLRQPIQVLAQTAVEHLLERVASPQTPPRQALSTR